MTVPPLLSNDEGTSHTPRKSGICASYVQVLHHLSKRAGIALAHSETSPPLAFLREVFSNTRDSLQLDPTLVLNLMPKAPQTILAGEGSTLFILCATVSGIVAISNQLDTVASQLAALAKENGELRTKLHDISSILANEVVSVDDLETLSTSVPDL